MVSGSSCVVRAGAGFCAGRDLMLQRIMAWSCTIGYFFGCSIWPYVVSSGT